MLHAPNTFGLPEKFEEWRHSQEEAIHNIMTSKHRFDLQVQPTGSGKSLCYVASSFIMGKRTCFLTSTKGLQDQLLDDFASLGLVNIKGKNAYRCRKDEKYMCDDGPCAYGETCGFRDRGCLYYDQVLKAQKSKLVVTNYAYWLAINKHSEHGLGVFDMLVLDEGHSAPEHLINFMAVDISLPAVQRFTGYTAEGRDRNTRISLSPGYESDNWRRWANNVLSAVRRRLSTINPKHNMSVRGECKILKSLAGKLDLICGQAAEWVVEVVGDNVHFEVVWPYEFAEKYLFLDIPKVVITSATIRRKTAEVLGVKEYGFKEFDSVFPVERRPVWYIPTVKLDRHSSEGDVNQWNTKINNILRSRLDRKGIIHTVSYKRRNEVIAGSRYKEFMFSHATKNTMSTVAKFKRAKPPAILVSPTMVTGWDFPGSDCEYQIVGKIGFPDTRSKVMQRREQEDSSYVFYLTMQNLVQACGRGMRSADDQCECFIIDNNFEWFYNRYSQFAPDSFNKAFKRSNIIPQPLGKL